MEEADDMNYAIERYQGEKDRKPVWYITGDGKRLDYDGKPQVAWSGRLWYPKAYRTRKDAAERIAQWERFDIWLAKMFEQDFNRVYEWDADEEKQIEAYAVELRANALRYSFAAGGRTSVQDLGRRQHRIDADMLRRRDWLDAGRLHVEKRRTMAARIEAFKRAGVTL
jgi:hypothetical protein